MRALLLFILFFNFISSHAQAENAKPSTIKADEHIVFFDTTAWFDLERERWIIPLHGWIYEPEDSRVRKEVIAVALKQKYDLEPTDATRANFDRRINLFLADNERRKQIRIRIAGRDHVLPMSQPNGHFYDELELPASEVESSAVKGVLRYSALLPVRDDRRFDGVVRLAAPQGISVISDIDDTVKVSHVTNHARLFDMTFFQDFRPVPGMAQLYSAWAQQGAVFHFVSSSPWQLYAPLTEFMSASGFPARTLSLKWVRFKDKAFFNLFKSGTETKPEQIIPLLMAYPKRRFILLGDSGEQDPEVYAAILRQYPGQILRVFLRNITGAAREDERFGKVFAGIEEHKWALFNDPQALVLPEN